jgi:sugar phosphate isomerase/epimerase
MSLSVSFRWPAICVDNKQMLRRTFIAGTSVAALAQTAMPPMKLGIDLFSIRSSNFSPFEFLDYAAKQGAKVVHFSEIRFIGSLDESNLKKVRARAEQLGIEVEIGMRSICPTSKAFDPAQGTAEQQLERMFTAANTVGSKIVRAFLGTSADRTGALPIEGHIENAAKVLRSVRSKAMDHNLKIAIENHAGDMQGRELKMLIDESGKDFVGACLDSGNPMWAIEDPHLTLEILAPYVLTSHIRDTAVWRVPEGAAVQWVRMGDGNIGIDDYVNKYVKLCPGKALSLEIIVTQPRIFPYLQPKFWDGYRHTPAWEFGRFLTLVEKGSQTPKPAPPAKEPPARLELNDLEASMIYTKKLLNL